MAVRSRAIRFRFACLALLAGGHAHAQLSGAGNAPAYTAAGIVNAATQTAVALAPNAIATIYGTNLAWDTYKISSGDVTESALPQVLGGVTVTVDGLPTGLFYVSPGQINFLIPYELTPGPATVQVLRDGVAGPLVTVQIDNASPGFFLWNGNVAIATHGGGIDLVSASAPAAAGETIVLYATGLGHTVPDTQSGVLARSAAWISSRAGFQVFLNGVPCPPSGIAYVGLTPQSAGLYQVNLKLPAWLPPNPVIQMAIGSDISPDGIILPTQ